MVPRICSSIAAVLAFWLAAQPPVAAGPALLYDATTRQVLYAEDVDHPWYPASLTKLMTAYIVFEAWKSGKANRASDITISARANSRPRMRLGLGAGKVITYDEAMAALIIHSANDIAVALAEAVAGSETAFVEMMNATATRLGMASTRFINANGLPGEGQHATARDLATLTHALLRDFPEHGGLFSLMSAPVGTRTVNTHNPVLLRLPGGDGMKTGFTCSAGYNIIASATRDGVALVAIVLGEQTPAKREARTVALLEHGFRSLEWKAIFPPMTLDTMPVEPFDLEQVRAANLAKRWKDCQAPEPELDADGNPVCPTVTQVKRGQSARAIQLAKAMKTAKGAKGAKAQPDKCAPVVAGKPKSPPQRAAKAVVKRLPAAQTKTAPAGKDSGSSSGIVVYGTSAP